MPPLNTRSAVLGVPLIVMFVLAACGSSDDPSDVTDADSGAPAMDAAKDGTPYESAGDGGHADTGSDQRDATDQHDAADEDDTAPKANALLAKVAGCAGTAIKGGFGTDGPGSISMYACGDAVYWKADLDVDCDGIQTPPCNTDEQGQPMTSIVDDAPNGDVDPTRLPYFVIPLGNSESPWYRDHGIRLGQVGAVIYKIQVYYGIFADEAGGSFIGEASYAMCQLFLGPPSGKKDPCDPNTGGIDATDITYVTFTGTANQAKGADIYNHEKQTEMGIAAAKAWIAAP